MSVLEKICADKQEHISVMKAQTPLAALVEKIEQQEPVRGFKNKIAACAAQGTPALIAEIKKASPSRGIIRENFNPAEIAEIYQQSGAACLSVLTDEPYFQGRDDYLQQARQAAALPVLRKDFMLDPYQIYESRALGADCVLLIMAALSDSQAAALYDLARTLTMDVLVEVHNKEELERALTFHPEIIGVNNRNLGTLDVDIQTARDLAARIPENTIKIAESGIYTHDEIKDLSTHGYHAFLVGESLMRQDDIGAAVRKLIGET